MYSKGGENVFYQNDSCFDFMAKSGYKLYSSRIAYESFWNEKMDLGYHFTKTSLSPAFMKLSESKNSFYNSIYSIKHLYEQNKQKIARTCSKLEEEQKQCDFLLETYSKTFVGTWSLLFIEYIINKFLSYSLTYEKYLDEVAGFSDRYSSYSDVLSYYLSLTNVYKKLTDDYYCLLNNLYIYGSNTLKKANEIMSHLLSASKNLEEYETQLNDVVAESFHIGKSVSKLQNCGFSYSFKLVKTKYYINSLLNDMVKGESQSSRKSESVINQINIIRNKVVLLKLLTKM